VTNKQSVHFIYLFTINKIAFNLNCQILTECYSHFTFCTTVTLLREALLRADIFRMRVSTGFACNHVHAYATHIVQTLPVTTKFTIWRNKTYF